MTQCRITGQPYKQPEKEVLSTGMVIIRRDYAYDEKNPSYAWSWHETRYTSSDYIVKVETEKEKLERELVSLEIEFLKMSKQIN